MTADGWEQSDQPVGGHGTGGAAAPPSQDSDPRGKTGGVRDWLRRIGRGDRDEKN